MKTFLHISIISSFFLFNSSRRVYAQSQPLQFEHLSARQGLPQSWVWSICQDREGFMWFGTYDGLYKYDGHSATSYALNPADPAHSLRSNLISAIHEDRKGRLWVTTWGAGLHQVDKPTGKSIAYPIDAKHSSRWDLLEAIYEDKKGILWLGTSLGIARFNPDSHSYALYASPNGESIGQIREDAMGRLWAGSYQFDPKTGKYTIFPLVTASGNQFISSIGFDIDTAGIAWLGTEGGLYYMDTRRPSYYTPFDSKGLLNKSIIKIYAVADYLWIGTTEGLQILNKKTNQITTYRSDPSQPGSLSNSFIGPIYWGRPGKLWLGTQNGINKASLHRRPFQAYQIIPTPPSFHQLENEIFSIVEDQDGTVWVSSAGHGLYRMNNKSYGFSKVVVNPLDQQISKVRSQGWPLLEDQKGRFWVGTQNSLYQHDLATGKFIQYPCKFSVRMLDKDASGKLWIGGVAGEMASFDPITKKFTYYQANEKDSTSLISGFIDDLMVSRTGEVWMATTTGVGRMNPVTGYSTRYQPNYRSPSGSINDAIAMALYEDQAGIIWIGTHGGGLNRLDPKTNTFTYYTTQQGLPSNRIMNLIGDEKGNIWIGTGNGLSRFNPKTNTFRNFNVSDGLPGNEFLERGSVFSRNGKLFFGNKDGLIVFYPDSIQEQMLPPPVYITNFKVLEKSQPVPAGSIKLPYDKNFLSFEFAAINYDAPEKNRYAYQLVGLENKWVFSSNIKQASYTDLDPGTYVFRVKATSDGKVWNEKGASLKIIIHPPPWKTWWAYSIYTFFVIASLLVARRVIINRERLKADLTIKQIESEKLREIDSLKSNFFANISHEFRTPLTLIGGVLEKLWRNGNSLTNSKEDYRLINRNLDRLLQLINQLLDLSKLEAGKLELNPQPGEIIGFLKVLASSFVSLFESKQITYSFYLPDRLLYASYDADKLEKIITNLLSNAFKFTLPQGIVNFRVDVEQQTFTSVQVKLVLEDNGIGISPEELNQIFERFHQADSSATKAYEGTGIGLALAKELLELHGGKITVASTPGKGTLFTVHLPLQVCSPDEAQKLEEKLLPTNPLPEFQEESTALPHSSSKFSNSYIKLLVIEDNKDLRTFIKNHFLKDYQILEAEDGLKGWAEALEIIPDLIISDVMMPKMDGVTLCEKLKTDERTSHIPVILLTAKADIESKLKGLESGADDYLAKPFKIDELKIRVRNLIEGRKKLRERFGKHISVDPKEITVNSVDEKFLQGALSIIETNMANSEFDITMFSKEIGMSRAQLHRKLTALTNQSANELIKNMRLKRAASLLRQHHGNASEIAYQVGFSSLNYFTKCFKELYGQTPSEYVRSNPVANAKQE
ncbi:two-component regulator propeller domain-containing protein [Adhaeribacter radiodurans]|uniref:histidine kinase n=1 Tax=Adhaeribacter radiodurans TaxID=2745197 RepID=A0A7L7LCF4_9BACT|nr:two-component regulator propeller domain-containing protein [Adhaeribacter radiodurans]QMU30049.1 response regulator [Adhaeribacter radiodurans]